MSALAVAGQRGWEDAGRRGVGASGPDEEARPAQPRLFALPGGAVEESPAPAAVASPPVAAPEVAPRPRVLAPAVAPVRTLDALLMDTWSAVSAGDTAVCPMCSGAMRPRWSAGAGVVGGRCADCGTIAD
jgi:hypothetical protein